MLYRQPMFGVLNPNDESLELSDSRQRVTIPATIFNHYRQKQKSNPTTARTQTGRYSLYNSAVSGDNEDPRFSRMNSCAKESQRCNTQDKENRFRSNDGTLSNGFCQNHPQKPAKYTVEGQEGQIALYCEKCAILVASQGFRVSRIKENPQSSKPNTPHLPKKNSSCKSLGANRYMSHEGSKYGVREAEIKSLVTCLEVTVKQIEMKTKQLQQTSEKCQSQFNLEVGEVEEFFDKLKAFVQASRKSYHKLLFEQNRCVSETIQDMREILDKAAKKTHAMKQDLLNNLETVYSIKDHSYRQIVDNYLANNRNFTGLVLEWKESELLPQALNIPCIDEIINGLRQSLLVMEAEQSPTKRKLKGDAGVIYFSFDATLPNQAAGFQNTLSSTSNIRNLDTYTIPQTLMCEDSSDSDLLL